ncbi:hypothetical protein PLICRDRAFT_108636 [Plicaturopsis crispa FD-325 SS-3]|nr:hypothetical protein PLICRDRAFT_108636 [Plicaturopsis crispa FD-325 SS-3]
MQSPPPPINPSSRPSLTSDRPPSYTAQPPPPSGYRIPLTTSGTFPPGHAAGIPPCVDADGHSPVFFGSALFERSVHPCKVAPHLAPTPCRVSYGGSETEHQGRYDLLPFIPETMEFVRTRGGKIPPGRRPVEGGYEEDGAKLYHAVATIDGVRVPGKAGAHLSGGCSVAFGGVERAVEEYEILCVPMCSCSCILLIS